jgi:HAD superfamily hydrolase (TIGR01549 family)
MARLALFDLDNTLVDREAAFALWVQRFLDAYQLGPEARSFIEQTDDEGMRPREIFFAMLKEQLGISTSVDDLLIHYHAEYPACFSAEDATIDAVRNLRSHGWKAGVVTNGAPSQWTKLKITGMADEFDAICISSIVGASKPDVIIFEEAARICGVPLAGWMVGDSATADIGGGKNAGLRTIWMARGRVWNPAEPAPDAIASTIPEAVATIFAGQADPLSDERCPE